jgi:hypothetical protein
MSAERQRTVYDALSAQLPMDEAEQALLTQVGGAWVKSFPDGDYLTLTPLYGGWQVGRSKAGDTAGWSEAWQFEHAAMAVVSMCMLLDNEQPVGWVRHIFLDAEGRSVRVGPH